MLKEIARKLLHNLIRLHASDMKEDEIKASALIFAPHPDDETLGCGGLLLKKVASKSRIRIVIMTDGGSSHQHLITSDKLAAIRRQEAIDAVSSLGISQENLFFFNFSDGKLQDFHNDAKEMIKQHLQEFNPTQVFVPGDLNIPKDHVATQSAVFSAAEEIQLA